MPADDLPRPGSPATSRENLELSESRGLQGPVVAADTTIGLKMITGYAIERLGSVELSLLFEVLVPKRGRCSDSGGLAQDGNRLPRLDGRTGVSSAGSVAGLSG
jgi:hypothetical protein